MSRGRRDVTPDALENRERDMELEDRAGQAGALQARVAAARELRPEGLHWLSEWAAGRDAAIAAALAGLDATAVEPPPGAGCRDCWLQGRDAAVEVLTS